MNQKVIKDQALVNNLASNLVDEGYEPLTIYLHDEEVFFVGENISELYPRWRMFLDGAVNSIGLGIKVGLISESGKNYQATTKHRF